MVSDSLSLVFTLKCNPRLNDILPEGSFQAAKRRWQCRMWGLSRDILHKLHVGFGVGSRGSIWLLIQKEAIRVPEKKQLRLQQKKSISWRSFYLETIAIILPTQEGINFYTAIKVLQQISKGIQHTHALLDLSQNIWLRSLRTHSLRKGWNLLQSLHNRKRKSSTLVHLCCHERGRLSHQSCREDVRRGLHRQIKWKLLSCTIEKISTINVTIVLSPFWKSFRSGIKCSYWALELCKALKWRQKNKKTHFWLSTLPNPNNNVPLTFPPLKAISDQKYPSIYKDLKEQ